MLKRRLSVVFAATTAAGLILSFNNCARVEFESDQLNIGDYVFLSDDMIVEKDTNSHPNALESGRSKAGVDLSAVDAVYWRQGLIPVSFERGFTSSEKALFFAACETWSIAAKIKCREKTDSDRKYLRVTFSEPGCFSQYGQSQSKDFTWMNLARSIPAGPHAPQGTCLTKGIITHELGHALGMIHEHQRPDRDQYVIVHSENVVPGSTNFTKFKVARNMGPYDFLSIMHYTRYNSSANGHPTMSPRPQFSQFTSFIGQAVVKTAALSAQDIL